MARTPFRVDVRTLIVLVASSGAVIWAYQRVQDTSDPVNRLTRLARAGDATERRQAIRMLFDNRLSEGVAGLIVEAMDDPDPGVRAEATTAAGQLRTSVPGSIEAIIRNLDAPEAEVRRASASALRFQKDQARAGLPVLLKHASDADPGVREGVLRAISAVEPDPNVSQPILLAGLEDPSAEVRRAALEVVGMTTLPPVIRLLNGDDTDVAIVAATKLGADFGRRMSQLQPSPSDRAIFDGLIGLSRRPELRATKAALLALDTVASGFASVRQEIDPKLAIARIWTRRSRSADDTHLPVAVGAASLVEPSLSISEEVRRSTGRYPEGTLRALREDMDETEKAMKLVRGELAQRVWRDLDSTDMFLRRQAAQSLMQVSNEISPDRVPKLFDLLEDDFAIRQAVVMTLVFVMKERGTPKPLPAAWIASLPKLIEAFELETDGGNLQSMAGLLALYTTEADKVVPVLHESLKKIDRIGPAFTGLTPLLRSICAGDQDLGPLRPLPATFLKLLDDPNSFTRSQSAALLFVLRKVEPEGREAHAAVAKDSKDPEIRRIAATGLIWPYDPKNPLGKIIRMGTPPPPAGFAPPPSTTRPPETKGATSQASGPHP